MDGMSISALLGAVILAFYCSLKETLTDYESESGVLSGHHLGHHQCTISLLFAYTP